MKKLLLTFSVAIFTIGYCDAQTPFFNVYGTSRPHSGQRIHVLSNGDCIVTGTSYDGLSGTADLIALRLNNSGSMVWNYKYGSTGQEWLRASDLSPSGDFYMMTSAGTNSMAVLKVDGNGDTIWTRQYTDPLPVNAITMTATADGGFALIGLQDSSWLQGDEAIKLVRCDASGSVLWSHKYSSGWWPEKIVECANGDLVVAGRVSNDKIVLMRVNANGIPVLLSITDSQEDAYFEDMAVTSNDIIIAGWYWNLSQLTATAFLRRISPSGTVVWEKTFLDQSQNLMPRAVDVNGSTITMVGDRDYLSSYSEGFVVQMSINGVLQSQHSLTFNSSAFMIDVKCTGSGQAYVTGNIADAFTNIDSSSIMVFRLNPVTQTICGWSSLNMTIGIETTSLLLDTFSFGTTGSSTSWSCIITSGIVSGNGCTVGEQEIDSENVQIYPNPFSTEITVSGLQGRNSVLILTDTWGRELHREILECESQTILCIDLAPGIYFYRIEQEEKLIASGKVIKE